ncbi:ATPase family, AAA [Seminavis robusta]|uniref:ATPase family, AAA n=1 Tax=Seminavis robusta TaxID=568900 RepID=A0A9N8ERI5_9STRA|nr:ATPase family, AAA [Seminavis robusta]|eukprot:Sro1883_g303430.1 ATPase family, AAA (254) ;mRNA; f:12216-12977
MALVGSATRKTRIGFWVCLILLITNLRESAAGAPRRDNPSFLPRHARHGCAFAFDDQGFLWAIRATSAVSSYLGLVGYLDRPRGTLIENAHDYLEVKPSAVEGAGLGLFAKVSLPKKTVLGTYPGVVLPLQQNLAKLQQHPQCEGYIWRFSDNKMVIDPTNSDGILDDMCIGGNPSMPLSVPWHQILNLQSPTTLCRINEPPLGRDVNVVTDEDRELRQVVFSLERDVFAGEEFFIDYGLSYDRSQYGSADSS